MHQHDGYQPHSHEVRADHDGVACESPMIPAARWTALRDYLAKTKASAEHLTEAPGIRPSLQAVGFAAQAEVLACALAKMEELEQS
jgi:hypothetical protein